MRKELAAKARERGRNDLAIRIAATKRPSPVVWLANSVAREFPEDITAVLDAGEAVRSAYASGDVAAIRDATQRRQQAASAALRRARTILERTGGSSANERRLAKTLLGASIDPPQAALLAKGRLEHEVEPPALEGVFAEAPKIGKIGKIGKIEKMAAEKAARTEKHDRDAAKAALPSYIQFQREAARATVTEFVNKWMLGQERFKPAGDYKVRVFFADEPIEVLGSVPPPFVREQ